MGRKKKNQMPKCIRPKIIVDTNEIMIDPAEKPILMVDVFDSVPSNLGEMSSKKRKRLEKYIETKLKKDARIRMLKKLEKSSFTSDLLIRTKKRNDPLKKQLQPIMDNENADEDCEIVHSHDSESDECSDADILEDDNDSILGCDDFEKSVVDPFQKFSDEESLREDAIDFFDSEHDIEQDTISTAEILSQPNNGFFVIPNRLTSIQEQREQLPVFKKEQEIVSLINSNLAVVVCGETGSGKTTQVPQFLYEYGYGNVKGPLPGMIGITQPRRVATVSMSKRVADELNLPTSIVSHQIRYDSAVSPETRIKFMTDGILLREISGDFLLSKYSIILIDEAHERNLNTDLLIGLLSRIINLRLEMSKEKACFPNTNLSIYPLRLVIMSATLRVSDFVSNSILFSRPPPVINVEGKMFNVNIHFARQTPADYVKAAYRRICQIHNTMPAGGILVFLTGRDEIKLLTKRLVSKFPLKNDTSSESAFNEFEECSEISSGEEIQNDQNYSLEYQSESEDSDFCIENNGDKSAFDGNVECFTKEPLHVLPLYSMLTAESQQRVFQEPPNGSRLVILATNIAETSITIPNIKYVVDCGKVKERIYQNNNTVQKFTTSWISKASADQRTGRAGRVSEGHCFRLFSSAVFEREFPMHSLPEIHRVPIDSMLLNMKAMHIDNVVNFPFPTPPDRKLLAVSEQILQQLNALDSNGCISQLGNVMAMFPLHPRLSRMLAKFISNSNKNDSNFSVNLTLLVYLLGTVSVNEFFMMEDSWDECGSSDTDVKSKRGQFFACMKKFGSDEMQSDLFITLSAYILWRQSGKSDSFCHNNFIRSKSINEADLLISQLFTIIQRHFFKAFIPVQHIDLEFLKSNQRFLIILLVQSYTDQAAILLRQLKGKPLYCRILNGDLQKTLLRDDQETLLLHPSSIFSSPAIKQRPKYVLFMECQQSLSGMKRIRRITSVNHSLLQSITK